MKIAVIGGGAAGLMAAIQASNGVSDVTVFERSNKFLSKVKISGGGRCNVTHQPLRSSDFIKAYPRGKNLMKKALKTFDSAAVMSWFEEQGVGLKIEADGRVFPQSDSSQSIMDALLNEARARKCSLIKKCGINEIRVEEDGSFTLESNSDSFRFDKVIVASGGSPKKEGLQWLSDLGYKVVEPVPSLFTFNIKNSTLHSLAGISVSNAEVRIEGTKIRHQGPLLITHWGLSGPAVLKCSAYGALELFDLDYHFTTAVNWCAEYTQDDIRGMITELQDSSPTRQIQNADLFELPDRLWKYILDRSQINEKKQIGELGRISINRLVECLTNDRYDVEGKTTFKEEFVTAGGVDTAMINANSMESVLHPGLFFCGEVLNVDGITGGFNFQAAWSTGYLAGKNASEV